MWPRSRGRCDTGSGERCIGHLAGRAARGRETGCDTDAVANAAVTARAPDRTFAVPVALESRSPAERLETVIAAGGCCMRSRRRERRAAKLTDRILALAREARACVGWLKPVIPRSERLPCAVLRLAWTRQALRSPRYCRLRRSRGSLPACPHRSRPQE